MLRVALKLPDGSVIEGRPRECHYHLLDRAREAAGAVCGFVNEQHKFLTRGEAITASGFRFDGESGRGRFEGVVE